MVEIEAEACLAFTAVCLRLASFYSDHGCIPNYLKFMVTRYSFFRTIPSIFKQFFYQSSPLLDCVKTISMIRNGLKFGIM